jgi:hypothetical protein
MAQHVVVRRCFAAALCFVLASAAGAAVADTQEAPDAEFADFLVDQGFAVTGVLGSGLPLRVAVTDVLAGSVYDASITIRGGGRPAGFEAKKGLRVIAWGVSSPELTNEYYGNIAVIGKRGEIMLPWGRIVASVPRPTYAVEGRPLSDPGTYTRLLQQVQLESWRNAADWLFSGNGIAQVEVDTRFGREVTVHLVSMVSGEAGKTPRVVWIAPPNSGGVIGVPVGTRFLLPVSAGTPDTLVVPVQVWTKYAVRDDWVPALGLKVSDISQAGWHDAQGMHLKRVRSRAGDR